MTDLIPSILETVQEEGLRKKLLDVYDSVILEFKTKPSSVKYHHAEVGGMGKHVEEVMRWALNIYKINPEIYDCTRDEVIMASFIHDFDKLGKYCECKDEYKRRRGQKFDYSPDVVGINQTAKVVQICASYGLLLSDKVINAITFHHGGFAPDLASVYPSMLSSSMTPLSVLMHCADLISSHILGRHP